MDKLRADFEKWLEETHGLYGEDVEWQEERNCYAKFGVHLAFNAWQAASNSPEIPDGWVSCIERMPNDKDYVWCWGKLPGWSDENGFEAYFDHTRDTWCTDFMESWDDSRISVTHWMPLPEPPKQDK
ncbi:Protein of uncharacterised function (DUF551) [Serratia ficaria]|uniref:DUF551 domain-containing protein n=1 Tax=Serratia ficaria TaxID=61651 RepID=UPI0021C4ED56|nr:DUF551 domain-containing protein [Serratia ficaria]CAI2787746.1 Protein of uncharacterised function (DUF551) [Serratia ficaria]